MMKQFNSAAILLILAAASSGMAQAQETRVGSSITAVTVYPGSAKVMRTSRLDLQQGINEVVIDDLPIGIIETSLRVDGEGEGDISLGSVQLQRNILRDVVQEKEKALRDQIEQVELVDVHRAVFVRAVAVGLAGMRADPPTRGRERGRLHEDVKGLLEGLVVGLPELLRLRDRHQHLADGVVIWTPVHARRQGFDEPRSQAGIL